MAVNKSAAIEFRCRGTPQGQKIATNNFGIREMSDKAPPAGIPAGGTTEQDLLETLAPVANTQVQVSITYALAGYRYDALLDYSATLTDPKAATACTKYYNILRNDIGNISEKIEDRNACRAKTKGLLPYPYFLPANMPNSTSV